MNFLHVQACAWMIGETFITKSPVVRRDSVNPVSRREKIRISNVLCKKEKFPNMAIALVSTAVTKLKAVTGKVSWDN